MAAEWPQTGLVMRPRGVGRFRSLPIARTLFCRFGLILASLWTLALLLLPVRAHAAEIWLSGLAPNMYAKKHGGETTDYVNLFQPGASWSRAASAVRVFKIYAQFAATASDAELTTAFADLRRRHIALALEAGLLTAGENCGTQVEGYGGPSTAGRFAERIRRAGGEVQYLAMDEPLWFGYQYSGPRACHRPMNEVARDVAANIAAFRRVFPAAQVGDIEPLGRLAPAGWVDTLMQWARAYREASGEPLAFLDVDVVWAGPWQDQMPSLATRLHAAGIKFGVIYDGDPDDQTGLAWTRHAEERFVAVETGLGLMVDQAVLQTWHAQPAHMLPETEPGTMTWLVNRYLAAPTRLTLHHVGNELAGELTDGAGHPLAGMPVTLSAEELGDGATPVMHTRSGRVPWNAAEALFTLRINTECECSGPADVAIGALRYHDDNTGQTVQQAFQPLSTPNSSSPSSRFQAQPGQAISRGSPRFPVTAGDSFTIQIPMTIDLASANSGYTALTFLDSNGKEVIRLKIPFRPVERPVTKLTTDVRGRFSLRPEAGAFHANAGILAEFSGDAQHRISDVALEGGDGR